MTEPRSPDDQPIDPATTPTAATDPVAPSPAPSPSPSPDPAESPTQAWPSLTGQDAPLGAAQGSTPTPAVPTAEPSPTAPDAQAPLAAVEGSTPDPATSPFEPAASLPATRVAPVGETGTFGASATADGARSRLRWVLALVGVLIVAVASFLIVSLVGGRPATSTAMGYMPANTFTYEEVRLDLPGDQRQKLASFLKPFPGFADQTAIEPKLDDLLDRIVKAASKDRQTWTNDIKPWFGGQVAIGAGLPDSASALTGVMGGANNSLVVVTITDRAKAIAWLTSIPGSAPLNRSTYGDADLFLPAANGGGFAAAINDKVMLAGTVVAVKAAIDSGGHGGLEQNDDVKAALATLDKDYVVFGVVRIRAYADAALRLLAVSQPGVLDKTQLDETVLALVPAWQATTARFENDALVGSSVGPSWAIGYDTANRPSDVLGHVPAKTLFYADVHDVGPTLTAVLGKFRALDETKPAFAQFDRALSVLGGADAVYGWWGDTAIVVSSLADGTIGGGLVIHPRDAALADRLMTTLIGFAALGGGSAGITTRTEDHNGTKITVLDLSAMPGMSSAVFPPGYKPEFAWATNANVTDKGYGRSFVAAVLDAGPGNSLAHDARFKGLLGRVGADNIGVAFVDLAGIRGLLEPLVQPLVPADKWSYYVKEIQPYLKPIDAIVGTNHKDGSLDRGSGAFTAH
jgi:hypothetical protein